MTRECFAKGVFSFITVFRDIKATKENQDVWYSLLKDLTDEQFEIAIMRICREVKEFYPTTNFVALVRDMVIEKTEDRALFAWESVSKAMAVHGAYVSVKFDDPVIHSVIDLMGGWACTCHLPQDVWMRKNFIDLYQTMAKKREHPEYLKGITEIENGGISLVNGGKWKPKEITTTTETKKLIGKE